VSDETCTQIFNFLMFSPESDKLDDAMVEFREIVKDCLRLVPQIAIVQIVHEKGFLSPNSPLSHYEKWLSDQTSPKFRLQISISGKKSFKTLTPLLSVHLSYISSVLL